MKVRKEKDFLSFFDENTGRYVRTGIIQKGKDTGIDPFMFALGGRGDPDQHEYFLEILQICQKEGIVPNFTTSGLGMTDEIAKICEKYCGAVAVSWYRSVYTTRAICSLVKAGVKTNPAGSFRENRL